MSLKVKNEIVNIFLNNTSSEEENIFLIVCNVFNARNLVEIQIGDGDKIVVNSQHLIKAIGNSIGIKHSTLEVENEIDTFSINGCKTVVGEKRKLIIGSKFHNSILSANKQYISVEFGADINKKIIVNSEDFLKAITNSIGIDIH